MITKKPRVLVFGTGSIGAVYSFILGRAVSPSNVFAVCRSNYDAASADGFTINSTIWGDNQVIRPQIVRSVEEGAALSVEPFDYVLVCAKALPSVPTIQEQIAPAVSPSTTIVLVQNGIGTEEEYRRTFPQNQILSTVVYLPATQVKLAVIAHREIELLHVGSYPATESTEVADAFAAVFRAGGGTVEVHADVQAERWSKLVVNASWNPICALSRSRDAQFLAASSYSFDLVRGVMLEIAAIARASGYPNVSTDLVDFQVGRATKRQLPGIEPSMLADARSGKNMEVDAIVGNAIRIAEDKNVETPLLRTIYALISGLDASFTRQRTVQSEKN